MVENKRLDWIDIAKGLGIISVVIGHVYNGYIHWIIFAFHMPLFFFLSGITLDVKNISAKKTFKSLMLPYISYLILISVIVILMNNLLTTDIWYYISFIKSKLYGGIRLTKEFGVFWFPTVLFLSLIVIKFIFNISRNVFLSFLTLLIFSYVMYFYLNEYKLPLGFEIVSISIPLILYGYIYRNFLNLNTGIWLIFSFIASFYLYVYLYINGYKALNMKNLYIGENGINYFASFIFLLLIIYSSKIIDYLNIKFIKNVLIELGKASITIMFLHQLIHFGVKENIIDNKFLLIMLAIIIPYIFHIYVKKNKYTSFLLGVKNV